MSLREIASAVLSDQEFIISAGAGLVLLGFGFILIDALTGHLLKKMKQPELNISDEELLLSPLPLKEKKRIRAIKIKYHHVFTHRMRRAAIVVIIIGGLILIGAWLFPSTV